MRYLEPVKVRKIQRRFQPKPEPEVAQAQPQPPVVEATPTPSPRSAAPSRSAVTRQPRRSGGAPPPATAAPDRTRGSGGTGEELPSADETPYGMLWPGLYALIDAFV